MNRKDISKCIYPNCFECPYYDCIIDDLSKVKKGGKENEH